MPNAVGAQCRLGKVARKALGNAVQRERHAGLLQANLAWRDLDVLPANAGAGGTNFGLRGQAAGLLRRLPRQPKRLHRGIKCARTLPRHPLCKLQNPCEIRMRIAQNAVTVQLAQSALRVEQTHQPLNMANLCDSGIQTRVSLRTIGMGGTKRQRGTQAHHGTLTPDQRSGFRARCRSRQARPQADAEAQPLATRGVCRICGVGQGIKHEPAPVESGSLWVALWHRLCVRESAASSVCRPGSR